jgi:hypothetical protein
MKNFNFEVYGTAAEHWEKTRLKRIRNYIAFMCAGLLIGLMF